MLFMRLFRKSNEKHKDKFDAKNDISAWAGALAHEIRNPLNTMKINLQLLEEELQNVSSERIQKRFDVLNKEILRLEQILNSFLRYARLPKPNFEKNDVCVLINELLDFAEPEAQQLNIKINKYIEPNLPETYLDSQQIKQALLNILINAYQSMPNGGDLIIKAYKEDSKIKIDVIDSGEGIPPERIDRLFDLFYSTKENGTGLGLSIARRIVDLHNGDIKVQSQEGVGSTFTIILPIYLSDPTK
ncbi:MAG: sensor histidine kinase [Candidatus Poribacteria bacterium]